MGAVRRLANWPSGEGGKSLHPVGHHPIRVAKRLAVRRKTRYFARETIGTAGYAKLRFTEIGVFWVAKAVYFSRTY
jgi:hypothetical protein